MREAMVYSCATVQIIGFAAFFLDGIQGNDVVAHLINVSSCGASGGDPGEQGEQFSPFRYAWSAHNKKIISSAAEKPAAAVLLDQHCVSAVCVLSLSS